jgi:hypothetical protein
MPIPKCPVCKAQFTDPVRTLGPVPGLKFSVRVCTGCGMQDYDVQDAQS